MIGDVGLKLGLVESPLVGVGHVVHRSDRAQEVEGATTGAGLVLQHRGVHRGGIDAADVDVCVPYFRVERGQEGPQAGFGRRVGRRCRQRADPAERHRGHEVAAIAGEELRQCGPNELDRTAQHDIDVEIELVGRESCNIAGNDNPGVADQYVEVLAPFTGDPLAQFGQALPVGQIAAHRGGLGADVGCGLFGQLQGAVYRDDVIAPLGEAAGHLSADAGGRAGDED